MNYYPNSTITVLDFIFQLKYFLIYSAHLPNLISITLPMIPNSFTILSFAVTTDIIIKSFTPIALIIVLNLNSQLKELEFITSVDLLHYYIVFIIVRSISLHRILLLAIM